MRILIIDNNMDTEFWGSADIRRLVQAGLNATIVTRRAPQSDLPETPNDFDRIILSGSKTSCLDDSPWIDQLIRFLKTAANQKKPTLGICFGHQIMIRAIGGKENLRRAPQAEFGWTEVQVTAPDSPLMKDIPNRFHSFSAHFEEVADLPKNVKPLARSQLCSIQAYQVEDLPIFGIQFHPEKSVEDGEKTLIERKKKGNPPHLLNPGRGTDLFHPDLGKTIFRNFLAI